MNIVHKGIFTAFTAIALSFSSPVLASGWYDPDFVDVDNAVNNILVEVSQLKLLAPIDAGDIKVVNIEDVLDAKELTIIENSLNKLTVQLGLVTLHNTLNNLSILNGSNVLTFANFLNNNNTSISDVIGVEVLENGQVLVFCCDSCGN